MERLTCEYDGVSALRELCTPDKYHDGKYLDCAPCETCCEDYLYKDCVLCPIQKAFDKLAAYEDAEENAKNKKMLNADIWINKLSKIVSDSEAPGAYKDYCLHLISEIEAELRAQEDK